MKFCSCLAYIKCFSVFFLLVYVVWIRALDTTVHLCGCSLWHWRWRLGWTGLWTWVSTNNFRWNNQISKKSRSARKLLTQNKLLVKLTRPCYMSRIFVHNGFVNFDLNRLLWNFGLVKIMVPIIDSSNSFQSGYL